MQDLINVVNALSGLPLHAVLLLAVIVLWRRTQALEAALMECLRSMSNENTENRRNSLK